MALLRLDMCDPPIPVYCPVSRAAAIGDVMDFRDIVQQSGMVMMTSGGCLPCIIVLGDIISDYYDSTSKVCILSRSLFSQDELMSKVSFAREIMRRLAYGFLNYDAREVVAGYHRNLGSGQR